MIDRDTGGLHAGPELVSRGVIGAGLTEELMEEAARSVRDAVARVATPDEALLRDSVREAIVRTVHKRTRRRPMVIPVISLL